MKTLFCLWLFCFSCAAYSVAQPNTSGFPSIASPTGTTEIRGSYKDILQRAVDAWKDVYDCRLQLHQAERIGDSPVNELWANISLTKPTEQKPDHALALLIHFHTQPFDSQPQDAAPEKVYFATQSPGDRVPKLYTYTPSKESVVIEWLTEDSLLPDFLKLVGFLRMDIEEINERAYFEADLFEEYINGIPTVRIQLKPRSQMKDIEPDRYLWLHKDSYLPIRFAVEEDVVIIIDFSEYELNQNIESKTLLPKVPSNTAINDLTHY